MLIQRLRATFLCGAMLVSSAFAQTTAPAPAPANPPKVLRYAFEVAETSLDPVRISDIYSRTLTPHIFEALYTYDHLARPIKVKPLTAAAMPEHSDDFRVWTVKVQPGIYFASDPAFKGRKRELVAQDFVYAFQRHADPANLSSLWPDLEELGILGFVEQHEKSVKGKQPFDYDATIEGLRALDRYTLQARLKDPRPRFIELFTAGDLLGAMAREVVEFYGKQSDEHPVGTGPFKLERWQRSAKIVLVRNPEYRERYYEAEPAADDAEGQALLARFKGRRLPMIDRVEISIITEHQPRWLSFVNGEADYLEKLPIQFVKDGLPNGKLAPHLAKRGIRAYEQLEPGSTYVYFNMDDPMVGGYTPAQIALRRAVNLGMDTGAEIRIVRRGRAVAAQTPFLPFTSGYDPKLKTELSDYDPARATALLDLYGFVDRDGDGWRERPDGSPLRLEMASESTSQKREIDDQFRKDMTAIGVRVQFNIAQWPENLKATRAGKLMMWTLGGSASKADGQDAANAYRSAQIGGENHARFRLPAADAILEKTIVMPDGPEREALFAELVKLGVAYMPYKYRVNRILTDMAYPWVIGYRRPVFWLDWWQYVDIDDTQRPKR